MSSDRSRDLTEEFLSRHLDSDFTVFPMAESRAKESQVLDIGRRVGVVYPPEFISHVCGVFPGAFVEVKASVWPRPKAYDVAPFWTFLYAVHTYTADAAGDPWMKLEDQAGRFQKQTGLPAAPILRVVGNADLFCVDVAGLLVQYDHEGNQLRPLKVGFWELFDQEIGELARRKAKKKGQSSS